jgi:hypothetical protein
MRVDLKGWLIVCLILVPCFLALRLATAHLGGQVALDAEAFELLYAEILFRQNELEFERMSGPEGASPAAAARDMLIRSTTVKGTIPNFVGRVEILIFRDGTSRDRYVHYFRLQRYDGTGWTVDWDVTAWDYYFGKKKFNEDRSARWIHAQSRGPFLGRASRARRVRGVRPFDAAGGRGPVGWCEHAPHEQECDLP